MTGLCFALISSLHLHRHIHVDHTQTCHGNTKMGLERSLHQGKENPFIKRLNRLSDKTMRTEFLKIPSMEQWLRLDCSPDLLQDIKRPNTLYWQTRRNIEKVWHMGPNPGRQTKNGGKSTFPYPTATHLKRIRLRKQLLIITHDDIDHNQRHMGTACLPFSRRLTKKQKKNEHTNSLSVKKHQHHSC